MKLIQSLISKDKYNIKCPYTMNPTGICIHNTANDASAKNEVAYMKNNNNEVSFHIAVDDVEAIQAIPFNRNAWHAGDGGSGLGNRNYISIEICYSRSGGDRFIKAEKNCAILVAQMLKERGWGLDRVKKHQDFSGKYCPHRTLDMGWQRFLNMIQSELNGQPMKVEVKQSKPTEQPKVNQSQSGGIKKYLYLKPHVAKWNVYPTNVAPVIGNQCGTLAPSKFGGLKYEILGNPQTDVYTIQTESFGRVNIYVPKDNDSEFINEGNPQVKVTAPTPQPKPQVGEYVIKEYPEKGVFTCTVDAINFRNKPYVSSNNPIQGQYYRGESVTYDYVVITNKYVWISWVSRSTGIRRYMPIREVKNGVYQELWGYIK